VAGGDFSERCDDGDVQARRRAYVRAYVIDGRCHISSGVWR
jgi:hypothetical protein